jgi:hypothetical protein
MKYYVYLHRRLDDDLPFYLGKGSVAMDRAFRKSGRSQWWTRTAAKHGYMVEILQWFDDENEAFDYERDGISALREAGYPLVNLTDGGEGASGIIRIFSDDHKKKLSLSGIGNAAPSSAFKPCFKIIATCTSTLDTITIIGTKHIASLGFNYSSVYKCLNGKYKQHKGYTFKKELL